MKRKRFLFLKSLSPMKARIQMTGGQPQSPCVMPSVISTLALVTVIGINKPNLGNPPYYVGGQTRMTIIRTSSIRSWMRVSSTPMLSVQYEPIRTACMTRIIGRCAGQPTVSATRA